MGKALQGSIWKGKPAAPPIKWKPKPKKKK